MFIKGTGNWTEYRKLPGKVLERDFHDGRREWGELHENVMADVHERALSAIQQAQREGYDYVLFTHGWSTSRPGRRTARSVIRGLARSAEATPYILRSECIQHESVFVARVRPAAPKQVEDHETPDVPKRPLHGEQIEDHLERVRSDGTATELELAQINEYRSGLGATERLIGFLAVHPVRSAIMVEQLLGSAHPPTSDDRTALRASRAGPGGQLSTSANRYRSIDLVDDAPQEDRAWRLNLEVAHSASIVEEPRRKAWFIQFDAGFRKVLNSLDKNLRARLLDAIADLSEQPTELRGDTKKPLSNERKGAWRYRIGDYRLIYLPEDPPGVVHLLSFDARGSVYR